MMKATGILAAAALSAAAAQVAHASNWTMTFEGYTCFETVGVKYDASKSWNSATAGSFAGVKAGQHNFSIYGKTYKNYCVQLFESVGAVGDTNVWCTAALADVPDAPPAPGPMGTLVASLVQDLYARFHASVQSGNNSVQCAAFQVVLWELTHENFTGVDAASVLAQVSLTNGAFQINANKLSVFNAANAMIADLGDGGLQSLGSGLFGLTNEDLQDHLVVVPIPAPALLAGLGLIGAAVLRRRMK